MNKTNALARLSLSATLLALFVVVLGAFVRLSDAGLGCPDWPVCYGHLSWPTAEEHIEAANLAFPERPVEVHKAWKEQVHRFAAALLGILVLAMALVANWWNGIRRNLLILSAGMAATGIVAYVNGLAVLAGLLSAASVIVPLLAAIFWRNDWRSKYTAGLLGLIIFQAMLGLWTVTLLVKPIIVTAHLLGGMATFTLLWLFWLRNRGGLKLNQDDALIGLRRFTVLALVIVVIQVFLGGWTSTNYAALACPDFPTCQDEWVPHMQWSEGFRLWRGLGIDYEGGVLDNTARVAIHWTHRVGALIVLLLVGLLVFRARKAGSERDARLRLLGSAVGVFLIAQILLGISVVKYGLPLWLAVAHNGGAALLLASIVTLAYALWPRNEAEPGND
ncbi:MAG: COX15/CtaA family protein [Gammaproteobacteria bacterium]|nr:COX15/CtaA family protein [Gammaproteobacteria bacterium]